MAKRSPSGLRSPGAPPPGDGLEVFCFYLQHWESEFDRARLIVKRRASAVVVTSSAGSAIIAVVGALTTATGWAWLGVVSSALAGAVGVVAAWDGLFRHRDLWRQRSVVLRELQDLRRETAMQIALGNDRAEVAKAGNVELTEILRRDKDTWEELRVRQDLAIESNPASSDARTR